MASVSLKDILGYVSLTKMVNVNVPDLPRRLPSGAYSGTPEKVEGDFFRFTQFTNSRSLATLTNYYAPSVPRQLRPIGQRDVKLFHTCQNLTFDAIVLEALRNFEDYGLQEKGKLWVTKQIADFRRTFKHLRDTIALLVLCKGKVYRNDAGDVLPSSSGATITCDFGINATTNQGTIAAITGVGGAWNSPTTNIVLQLETLKIKAQQAHGYIPEVILYGKNIPTYLTTNDHTIPYLSRNATVRDSFIEKGYITPTYDLFDYRWYPIADAGFNNAAGTYQLPIGDDDIVFVPQFDESWWGWAEGSYMVPSTLNILNDLDAMIGALNKLYGAFGYSKLIDDPARLIGIMGDTFTPYIKLPDVVYQLTAI